MNPDNRVTPGFFQSDDDLGHCRELVAATKTVEFVSIAAAWCRQSQSMMGVPIAEVTQAPIGRESFTELSKVFDVKTKVCIVALRIRSRFRGEENRGDILPPSEQIATCLDGPC